MIEFKILYWYWLAFGMFLIITELFIPSFTIIWFGMGAIAVALILMVLPNISINWQLFIWTLASCGATILWFKLAKPLMADHTKAGISKEAIMGEKGQVIKIPEGGHRGIIRFTTPLLGEDEWPFICETRTEVGDRLFVKDISGNTLIIEKR